MLTPSPRPRGARVLLWASATLFILFTVLSFAIWFATRVRFEADPKLLDALQTAEFLEEIPASSDTDWPQWRGPRRAGVATARALLTNWPADGPNVLWEKDVSANEGYSS